MLLPGDPAPVFRVASSVNPKFVFDTVAGRYVVISFFGSSQIPSSQAFLSEIVRRGDRFDVNNVVFFGVTNDPGDVQGIKQQHPGRIYFYDLDLAVSRKFGVVEERVAAAAAADDADVADDADPIDGVDGVSAAADDANAAAAAASTITVTRQTFVLDQSLRVVGIFGMKDDEIPRQVDAIVALLDSMPKLQTLAAAAPVLIVPHVFEPELCRRLIDYYQITGGEDSGFMRDVGGKTVGLLDYAHKRRMDCEIIDDDLIRATQERIKRRVVPAIRQAYQFHVTRIERHIVACYDADQGAHFRAHRDNTTLGTAHRRFAITINLNSPDYEGGEIWFPEFGPHKYKAPSGAAIVFSCSLLHEVPRVTRGTRYAFLPFLYDDAAAAIRERNRTYLGDLSGAAGAKVTHVCASTDAAKPESAKVVIDGSAGCGNPEGCQTCLTSAAYPLATPAAAQTTPQTQKR